MTDSRIATDLDPDADGKQLTRLFVPSPSDRSAWGGVVVPIASIKSGDGPRVLLTAGAHGDEYEGPLALWDLARALEPSMVRGQVIVIPAMNMPGMDAGSRISPIDRRDLNRSFPGEREGSPTSMLAHYVSTVLLPRVEAVLDFHSGGRSLTFLPCAVMHALPDAERRAATRAALEAFGAPWALVLEELDAVGMLDTHVEDLGKLFLSTELGGGGRVSPRAATIARRGAWNVLEHLGVLRDRPKSAPAGRDPARFVEVPDRSWYVIASHDGVWEPRFELGANVRAGDVVARVHFPREPERDPIELAARHDGVVFAERAMALAQAGDPLVVIAREHR